MENEEAECVNAVQKGFQIVEALKSIEEAGVTEVSREVDMPKSTTHNYLKTLESSGMVINHDGHYRLSLKFLDLGGYARNHLEIYQAGKDEIDNLAEETGELANLLVEENGKGVYIYQAEGENTVPVDTWIGKRTHLTVTALGKAILAHYSRDHVEEILDRHGLPELNDNTITDPETFYSELSRVSDRGVAFDDEERLDGIRCVAAPVRDADGAVLGAISVAGPTHRLTGDYYEEELPERVLQAANVTELGVMYS
ncbi:MAG: IclR family transcriptional regulator [Halodesulfurarchaeum sp.]